MATTIIKKCKARLNDEQRELIMQNMHLVKMIASKIAIFLPRHIDTEDLIHEGLVGLMDAAVKYDQRIGMKFTSYASIRIKGAILDSLRSLDWIPRRVRKISKSIDKARGELQQKFTREPTMEEISEYLQISSSKLHQVMSMVEQSQLLSFEDLKAFTNRYFVPEEWTHTVNMIPKSNDYERIEIQEQLKQALSELNERERMILSLYYLEDLTLKEIKHILDISEARISQIHTNALRKLRKKIYGTTALQEQKCR